MRNTILTTKRSCRINSHGVYLLAVMLVFLYFNSNVPLSFADRLNTLHQVHSLKSESKGNFSWQLHLGENISPEQEYTALKADPSQSDSNYQDVIVPGNLVAQANELSNNGSSSVWYRLIFNLSEQAIPELDESVPMALRLGEISDRDRTYLNGVLIGETGRFDSPLPQAYDLVRIYEIPYGLLNPGTNVLHIQVQGYFPEELGIYRDRVAIGPASDIWREFYLENAGQTMALMIYATFALYFLLFFIRRRQELENLYFALFLFALVVYSLLRTQFKYIYDFELYELKRIQTLAVIFAIPLLYLFIRRFFPIKPEKLARIWDRIALIAHAIALYGAGVVLFSSSTVAWQATLDNIVQPGWLVYCIAMIVILVRELLKRNRDAFLMLASLMVLMVALVVDILVGRAILNIPPLLTYAFVLFVISMALILVNRFVRLQEETISLNKQLVLFNKASRRFVPFEFLNILEKGSIVDVNLGDQVQKEMSILFSDIRSFTSLSEKMSPRENFDFINSYLRRMGPVIRNHGGFIDKYIGDAIMALFATDADSAVRASIEMLHNLYTWNESRQEHGMVPIRIGIGIHIGRLMLGTIGENERLEGTVIADSVNQASRIEGLTKLYGAAVLLSGETKAALKDPGAIELRLVDRVRVKGKSSAVDLYEMLDGLQPAEMEMKIKQLPLFNQAMHHYITGELDDAEQLFTEIYKESMDVASDILIRRCRSLKEVGLPENWDGTTTLTSK